MDIVSAKTELRRAARHELGAMGPTTITELSAAVCKRLSESGLVPAHGTVLAYLPIPGSAEVDVVPFAEEAAAQGMRVCFPVIDWERRTMTPVAVEISRLRTEVRQNGVPEPTEGTAIDPSELDLVIVPGLAFDPMGGRLGRGAGYYDRFLSPFAASTDRQLGGGRPKPVICGVGFERQLFPQVPTVAQDVRMHAVVTDARLIVVHPGL